jgi:microsomal dipeptidase-like Zn-dependent dipeptidase
MNRPARGLFGAIEALAVAAVLLAAPAAPASANHECSGPGQPPCSCGFLCFDCDYVFLVTLGQCSDADGWPAGCGGEGERPCTITEHIPSCKPGLAEVPFPGGKCTRLDADGFPTFCGGVDERACALNEHIPSCKTGLIEERGVCRARDADGYPTSCGGADEPACELTVQIIIGKPSCKTGLVEERGICRRIDVDGFPTSCGGDGEPGCDLTIQILLSITSCKPCHIEIPPVAGTCRIIEKDRYPSSCGGCDQPACTLDVQAQIFQPACLAGLTDVGGTCRPLDPDGNRIPCSDVGEPGLGTTAMPAAGPPGAPVWGFADLHTHPFSNLAFGGLVVWGSPFDASGIASAVPGCDYACGFKAVEADGSPIAAASFPLPPGIPVHGPFGALDLFGAAGTGHVVRPHAAGGYPRFDGWPGHDLISHQQMYHRWIERAWRGGLRLMVAHAVNNEVLCRLSKRRDGFACGDMPTVDRQIQAVKDMEAYIDARSGGPGRGWFRIATSAAQARRILESGKLAVVIGIEVDSLFDCGAGSTCTRDQVRDRLRAHHAQGVRHLLPVHLFDNGFGGTALYEQYFNAGNWILSGDYLKAEDCSSEGVEFALEELPDDPASTFFRTIAEALLGVAFPTGSYPPGGHCNPRGLTPLGESLVKLMMGRKMILDVDHMSYRATDRALEIAVENGYPVVAGHTRFLDAMKDGSFTQDHLRAEYAKLGRHVDAIRDLGGIVAPLLHQGHASDMAQVGSVPPDCSNSTKTWVQAYLHAVDRMSGGPHHRAVALGSDFNGGISTPGPRFGPEACEGDPHPDQGAGVSYPFSAHGMPGSFDRLATGGRVFDFNQVGLANVGLLPDFVEDLKAVGLTEEQLEPLFESAEAYVAMWERIEAKSLYPPASALVVEPAPNAAGWSRAPVEAVIVATAHPDGWPVASVHHEASGAQTEPPAAAAGAEVRIPVAVEGETTFTFHAEDEAGNVEPVRTAPVRIDWTPPAVAFSGGAGVYPVDRFLEIACSRSDALSGIGASTCRDLTDPAYRFPLGPNTVTAEVEDLAGNVASASISFEVTVDVDSLSRLVERLVTHRKTERFLLARLRQASLAGDDPERKERQLEKFRRRLAARSGRGVAPEDAAALAALADAL